MTFLLYDGRMNPVEQFTTDQRGYAYIDTLELSGKVYLRELDNDGYIVDEQLKTVYVRPGETTEVTWENTPITGQIQITKKSADYNPTTGLPAGTPLEGAVFEITDRAGNLVDTIRSDSRGLAVSKPLPLSRYTIREIKAPEHYGVNETDLTAYLEHPGQIVRFEVTNKSLSTGVSITKTGPAEIMAGQPVRYVFSGIANTSNVRLDNFYWRDTIPAEVRLDSVVTGTYSFPGVYKVTYRVNGGEPRTLADNLSTAKSYTIPASPVALELAANERVTEVMFLFGQAPAGFAQVEKPYLYDWFCQDDALAGRLKKIGKVVMGITDPFILDNFYVWFKNNCPMRGPLYDDVRFEPLSGERGGKYFLVALDSPHEKKKWALITERHGFEAPEFECADVRDMTKYINGMARELEQGAKPAPAIPKQPARKRQGQER